MSEKPTYEELERRVRELEQAESELKQAKTAQEESQRQLSTLMRMFTFFRSLFPRGSWLLN